VSTSNRRSTTREVVGSPAIAGTTPVASKALVRRAPALPAGRLSRSIWRPSEDDEGQS
jgi:hypothetical protein